MTGQKIKYERKDTMATLMLYRGLRNEQEKIKIQKYHTAGGAPPAEAPRAPSPEEMAEFLDPVKGQKYTQGECAICPSTLNVVPKLTEYTTEESVATSFAHRSGWLLTITIDSSLVNVLDDQLEHGAVIRSDTPLQSVFFYKISKLQ